MFLLRDVRKSDLPGLQRLASVLNTVNLPDNGATLARLIELSTRSFSGKVKDPTEREYLFVLEDTAQRALVGTSMIIAQHGTYDSPHVYYEVSTRERYSASLERHFRHKVLSIGYNYEGPTEIGGLVVEPAYRSGPEKPGKQLSYVRFLFMAMHRKSFRERVLAELLPPLLPDGRSLLWEAVGKKFTGLTYQEADRLSRQNKEFIKELFPPSEIYATLFPARTRDIIGEVGPETRGVQRMLERIGFRYVEHVDPFDGGPHFEAAVDDITLVRAAQGARLTKQPLLEADAGEDALIGFTREHPKNRFRAVRARVSMLNGKASLPPEAVEALEAPVGTKLTVIPFL